MATVLLSNRFKGHAGGSGPGETHRLGELLVEAGILRAEKLPEALLLAKKTGSPIGRVLVMLSCVDQTEVDSALQIQRLIRDSTIAPDVGVQLLQESASSKQPISALLAQNGQCKEYVIRNALGELLVDAGMITRQALTEAIRVSTQAGMPLGKYLSLTGTISAAVLFEALNAQVAIRDRKISRDQAISMLKDASIKRHAIVDKAISQSFSNNANKQEVKFGELLCLAEVISETDILAAVELGLFRQQPVGQVLVDAQLIPSFLVQPTIELQQMVAKKELRPMQAAQVLMTVQKKGVSLQQAIKELGLGRKQLDGWKDALELLRSAGLLGEHIIKPLTQQAEKDPANVGKIILESGQVDELLFQAALRCHLLLVQKKLRRDQAVIALHYCMRSRTNLDDALNDLAYNS